jgi:ribosomal protein S18 acetylase RimI-like enzyme
MMTKPQDNLTPSDLNADLDKLHTTDLGEARIRRNLDLQIDDVALWCKEAIEQADIMISKGKNWYVYRSGVAITINAQSHTIITAHKINAKVRAMRAADYVCLPEFLYQAIFIPEGAEPPSRSIVSDPQISAYIKDFGTRAGDFGVVAEQNGQVIGGAWTRIIPGFGHIDGATPELAISIFPEFRGYGIGTKIMKKLFRILRDNRYARTSLSVQKGNLAVRFYERLGYRVADEIPGHARHDDFIMVKDLR